MPKITVFLIGVVCITMIVGTVMYIVEGGFSMGKRRCGPGTVVYIEAGTQYGFEVWEEGVRFLNIRPGIWQTCNTRRRS